MDTATRKGDGLIARQPGDINATRKGDGLIARDACDTRPPRSLALPAAPAISRHYWISNYGTAKDIARYLKEEGQQYTVEQLEKELAYERKKYNRLTVVKMIQHQMSINQTARPLDGYELTHKRP